MWSHGVPPATCAVVAFMDTVVVSLELRLLQLLRRVAR